MNAYSYEFPVEKLQDQSVSRYYQWKSITTNSKFKTYKLAPEIEYDLRHKAVFYTTVTAWYINIAIIKPPMV